MPNRYLKPGDVVAAYFPEHYPSGHEQEGRRPAIVIGIPSILGTPRFPTLVVVPLTTDKAQSWIDEAAALYPRIPEKTAGLSALSIALLDQIRALGASRIKKYLGTLKPKEFSVIKKAIKKIFQF